MGAHGAGLTHIMFKKPGVGGVVEIKPEKMDYMGFRNLAKMNGNQYWSTHAKVVPLPEEVKATTGLGDTGARSGALRGRDPWHFSNLRLDEAEFMRIVGGAIRALTGEGEQLKRVEMGRNQRRTLVARHYGVSVKNYLKSA